MKKILLGCLFLFSSNLFAVDTMEFVLTNVEDKLRFYLLNSSFEDVLVNKRFAIGPSTGANEVEFSFIDAKGNDYPFSAKIRLGIATDNDFMLLTPSMLIGKEFNIEQLVNYYSLKPGNYSVRANYHHKSGIDSRVYGSLLVSNTLNIRIN